MRIIILVIIFLCTLNAGEVSAWLVEWQFADGLAELRTAENKFTTLQIFAANFQQANAQVVLSEKLRALPNKEFLPPLYLTVVNDVRVGDKFILKDASIVARVLANAESRAAHQANLLALMNNEMFIGLELDYENVAVDDWQPYLDFCGALAIKLHAQNKKLRVVLEPKKRYFAAKFPPNIEVVLMAYNLCGGHSAPGPKADENFIKQLFADSQRAKIAPILALASGGFIWTQKKSSEKFTAKTLTEIDAENIVKKLAQQNKLIPQRDEKSQYLFFSYSATEGNEIYTVWYADATTIRFLRTVAQKAGFENFALWRLGGNNSSTLSAFFGANE